MRKINCSSGQVFLIMVAIIVFGFTLIRSFFGVEITDEALYIAEPYIITQGSIPFVNNWGTTLFASITAPLIYFYTALTGSTEGVMLFTRITFLMFKIAVIIMIISRLRKHAKTGFLFMSLIPFIAFTPYSISNFSYNTIPIVLILVSGVLVVAAISDGNQKHKKAMASVSGVLIALSAMSYPPLIVVCVMIAVILAIVEWRKYKNITISTIYALSGMLVALLVIAYLCIAGGGIINLLQGIDTVINENPYFFIEIDTMGRNINSLLNMLNRFIVLLQYIILTFLAFISIDFISRKLLKKRLKESSFKRAALFSLIIGTTFYLINICLFTKDLSSILSIICALLFPLPLLLVWYTAEKRALCMNLLLFLWLPNLMWLIIAGTLTYDGIDSRYYFLFPGCLLTLLFSCFAIEEQFKNREMNRIVKWFPSTALAIVITISFLVNYFMYMYRDEPFYKLDYRVKSGVYAGLYTTLERGEALELLETEIRGITSSQEKVLFMDTVPMAYLMTDALHCAPSTWDVTQYSYGFNDDTLLHNYFKVADTNPDKIIYIYTGRDDVLSIDKEGYKFNEYVNSNYELIYNNDVPLYYIKVYKRKIMK